jgi:hypothetical protein
MFCQHHCSCTPAIFPHSNQQISAVTVSSLRRLSLSIDATLARRLDKISRALVSDGNPLYPFLSCFAPCTDAGTHFMLHRRWTPNCAPVHKGCTIFAQDRRGLSVSSMNPRRHASRFLWQMITESNRMGQTQPKCTRLLPRVGHDEFVFRLLMLAFSCKA